MSSTLSINRVTFTPFASFHPVWGGDFKNF